MNFKPKHTKGNWYAVGYWVEHEDDDVPDICNCDPESMGQEGRSYDEITANARLLAAAPAMFELLAEVANHPDVYSPLADDAKTLLQSICG